MTKPPKPTNPGVVLAFLANNYSGEGHDALWMVVTNLLREIERLQNEQRNNPKGGVR